MHDLGRRYAFVTHCQFGFSISNGALLHVVIICAYLLRLLSDSDVRRRSGTAGIVLRGKAVVIRSASAKLPPWCLPFRHRFFPPTKGFAAACFIHEATWCSSRSSTDASSMPRVDLPMPIGVTGGSGLISVPRMNISFT